MEVVRDYPKTNRSACVSILSWIQIWARRLRLQKVQREKESGSMSEKDKDFVFLVGIICFCLGITARIALEAC